MLSRHRSVSGKTFKAQLRREGFSCLGINGYFNPNGDGILIVTVNRGLHTVVGAYNASTSSKISIGQVVVSINGRSEPEIMAHELSHAPVLDMTINTTLTPAQAALALEVSRRKKAYKELESLKEVQLEELDPCSICLEEMDTTKLIVRGPCGHCFHKACIYKWALRRRPNCPLCKLEFARDAVPCVR